MKAETKQRIKKYRQDLPHMREKVFAAFLMLLVATCVAATATYAWVTLSSSPEVSGMVTSMAANGNLEIALSKEDGSQPDEFDIDESVTTKGSDVTVSNLQWGNLVNLSDASYGIDDIRLRPARLNTASLLNNPLWGAVYSADGRIETLNYNYTYTVFDGNEFLASDKYGVRAISSYILKTTDATAQERSEKINAVANAQTKVAEKYEEVISSFSIMSNMINAYVGDQVSEYLGSSSQTDLGQYIADMIKLYEKLLTAMDYQKDAYVALANLQIYLFAKANSIDYVEISWRDIEASCNKFDAANAANKNETISITGLAQFVWDYNTLAKDLTYLKQYDEDYKLTKTPYYWGTGDHCVPGYYINNMINRLIQYNDMYLYIDDVKVTFAQIKSYATQLLGNSEREVFIEYGIIKRFEQSCIPSSNRMNGRASVNIKYSVILNVKGSASTTATGASYFEGDLGAAQDSGLDLSDAVAEDTYGLVVDLWVRTNAEETCLTLEPATANDENGNIVSYDGLNRVWGATGEANLTHNSTTQGGGSCYVFYADSPEDQARSLSLLDAMKVAFVGEDGQLMATATMDTENYYAANGRVTVPLVIDTLSGVTYTYEFEDDTGAAAADVGENASGSTTGSTEGTDKKKTATVTGLAILKADQPIRVTAIIYLDGDLLENEDVLAENNIQGSLNIQFGSSQNLTTIGDSDLLMAEREVTATLDDGKTKVEIDFDDANSKKNVTVTVAVEGTQPTNMTACFLRAINSMQGTREKEMEFRQMQDGTWTVDYTFTAPGTYYLRYIRLDGVEYALEQPLEVTVKSDGYTVQKVEWSVTDATVRTSDSSYPITVNAKFVADDVNKLPKTVEARLVRADGNTANITMARKANGEYTGTTTITTSGVWTLQYLLLDGNYYDLGDFTRTVDLALGLYVKVEHIYGQLTEDFKSEENKTYDKELAVTVYDNVGNKLEGLENLTLYYSYGSSATNTRNAKLAYNESDGKYYGTLALDAPGRYNFLSVQMGNSYLTRCTESPTYILTSPDPVIYDKENSGCTLNDENGIQFAPLSTDAKINNICIENAGAATVQVVVYNEIYGDYLEATAQTAGVDKLYITLPTYRLPTGDTDEKGEDILGEPTQEGKWYVVAMYLTDCTGDDGAFHTSENPLIWVADDSYGANYLSAENIESCERMDFSDLATEVSSKVEISMTPGTTALGNSSTPFGAVHYLNETGMSVQITNGSDRTIPKDKITSVTLNLTYNAPKDTSYGYAVTKGNDECTVTLTYDADTQSYTVDADDTNCWVYVGEYKVTRLEVVLSGGKTLTLTPGTNNVPTMYTVTSAAPTANDVNVTVKQGAKEFGKTGNNITGTFLEAYSLKDTYAQLSVTGEGGIDMSYATVPDVEVKLHLTHENNSKDYGGYTFSGSKYSTIEATMTSTAAGRYALSGNQVLLAGTYTGYITVTGKSEHYALNDKITVYSAKPDVTVTGVSNAGTAVQVSPTGAAKVDDAGTLFSATNTFGDYYAVVYMQYGVGAPSSHDKANNCGQSTVKGNEDQYANYTKPVVTFKLSDTSEYGAELTIPNNEASAVNLTNGTQMSVEIGTIVTGTDTETHTYENWGTRNCTITYTTETASVIGTQTIESVTTVVDGVTYIRNLKTPIVISQTNEQNPTLTWSGAGMSFAVTDGTNSYTSGVSLKPLTKLTVTVTAENGYHAPKLTQPAGAIEWTVVSEDEQTAKYTFKMPSGNVKLTGTVTSYPTLIYNSNTYADVTVQVNGETINSGTRVKTGVTVTVTATAKDGYYAPTIGAPAGATGWTQSTGGDDAAVYTFTMPNENVTVAAPNAAKAYRLNWTDTGEVKFVAKDATSGKMLATGSFVPPNHTVEVTVTAPGGLNPELTAPTYADRVDGSSMAALYRFTMPGNDVTLAGKSEAYPMLTFGNDFASVSLISGSDAVDFGNATEVGVMPGNLVTVTLTAKAGYYAPRMTKPDAVAADVWTVIAEGNDTATYRFIMTNDKLDIRNNISATSAPTVTFAGSGATMTIGGTNYDGSALNEGSGTKVQPGTVVTVKAKYSSGFYSPTVTATGASLSARTPVGNGYDEATYTFTMGTSSVTLTAAATADPTVTVSLTNGITSATVNGANGTKKIHPGETVTVVVTAGDAYYNPTLTSGATFTSNKVVTKYASHSYTFTMPAASVTLTGKATANPTVTVSGTNATVTTSPSGSVRPGTTVTVTVTPAENYYNATATATGVTLSNAVINVTSSSYSFTMPENAVSISGTAIEKPYITFTSIKDCDVYVGTSAKGTQLSVNGKYYVLPGESVTIFAENTEVKYFGNYNKYPVISNSSGESVGLVRTEKTGGSLQKYDSTWVITIPATVTTGAIGLTATGNSASS